MRRPFGLLLLFPLLVLTTVAAHALQIREYRVIREPVADRSGRALWAIRSFQEEGVPHRLAVDPATLQSFDLPASSLTARPAEDRLFSGTRLGRALRTYTSPPFRLQNGGATHAETRPDGLFLTVDLCPSKRPFEREMFEAAAALSTPGKPAPVAVMVSGLWLAGHPAELAYLKGEIAAGRLAVTWVNHSWHHHYDPKAPLAENFLLAPGTDFVSEVLELEQQLLSEGLVPAPFFRFPGLVSDRLAMTRLAELSLVPLGADAWLAKGEEPRRGSFILVHGNGNEPKGIKLVLPLLKERGVRLLPLPAAFAD